MVLTNLELYDVKLLTIFKASFWNQFYLYSKFHDGRMVLLMGSGLISDKRDFNICSLREHSFNLKGGGGGLWFFSESKYFFPLRSAAEFFFPRHYFFSTKTIFFKAQSANRIFFSAHFKDKKKFNRRQKIKFPKNHSPYLQVKWMFPKYS